MSSFLSRIRNSDLRDGHRQLMYLIFVYPYIFSFLITIFAMALFKISVH